MAQNNNPTHVITGKCRLSYPHIWEPSRMGEDDPLKYSACIIIPKLDKATVDKILAAQKAAVEDGIKSKWKGKKPANLKLPLRDGDEEAVSQALEQNMKQVFSLRTGDDLSLAAVCWE